MNERQKDMIRRLKISQIPALHIFTLLIFLAATAYFMTYGSYLLSFQKEQYLFVYSFSNLKEFFLRPGGLLELSGKFLTQFFEKPLAGALILAFFIILPGVIIATISKTLENKVLYPLYIPVVATCMVFLMQTHYYHFIEYSLGFSAILLFLRLSVKLTFLSGQWIILVIFPVFCYFAGGIYSITWLGAYLIFIVAYQREKLKLLYSGLLILTATCTFLIFKNVLFLLLPGKLLGNPMPLIKDPFHNKIVYAFIFLVVVYPLFVKWRGIAAFKVARKMAFRTGFTILVPISVIFITKKTYNEQIARVVTIEQLAFDEKWKELIDFQEKTPSVNKVGQYFYDVALAETGQLCNRLFNGRQDFRELSLALPWSDDFLVWGGYFFYTAGLVNEAHRWAYEEMVVYNPRPHNIEMLVRTNLVNGNYVMADKYLSMLKKTIFYRKWAAQYSKCTSDTAFTAYPELLAKRSILPVKNFYVYLESPEGNLPALFEANGRNRVAFEYMMAYMMLTKNVESIAASLKMLKNIGYTRIPRHLEEAAMIYYNSKKVYPDLGGLSISETTQHNFDAYFRAYIEARKNPDTMKERMRVFGNTFWYYYHFN